MYGDDIRERNGQSTDDNEGGDEERTEVDFVILSLNGAREHNNSGKEVRDDKLHERKPGARQSDADGKGKKPVTATNPAPLRDKI